MHIVPFTHTISLTTLAVKSVIHMSEEQVNLERAELNIKVVVSVIVGIILFVAWFYNSVVIPINNMQLQLTQVQITLLEYKENNQDLSARLNVVENKLDQHTSKQ